MPTHPGEFETQFDLSEPDQPPLGLEAVYEFNGLILGDHYQLDRYFLKDVTGLSDSEIRETREPRPGAHGTYAYESFFGGKTIVFEGEIQAGNLNKLRSMIEDMKIAFGDLVEAPLYIRRYSFSDDFRLNLIADYYNYAVGSGFVIENGFLVPSDTSEKSIYYKFFKYRDNHTLIKFHTGESTSGSVGAILKLLSATNVLDASVTATELRIRKQDEGVWTDVDAASVDVQIDTDYYLHCGIEGNYVWAELWSETPSRNIEYRLARVEATLTGAAANKYGDGIPGHAGLRTEGTTTTIIDEIDIRSLAPADLQIMARMTSRAISERQPSPDRFTREFQLTLMTSEPFFETLSEKSRFQVPEAPAGAFRGRWYDREYNLRYTTYVGSNGEPAEFGNRVVIPYGGTAPGKPIIRLYGRMEDPVIFNHTNGSSIRLSRVPEDDYLDIDTDKGTIINKLGQNAYGLFDASSQMIELDPGDNDLEISFNEVDGLPRFNVYWKDRRL